MYSCQIKKEKKSSLLDLEKKLEPATSNGKIKDK